MTSLLLFLLALAAPPTWEETWGDEWGAERAPNVRSMGASGKVDWCSPGVCPTFLWSLDQSPDATVTPEIGPVLIRKGTPTRVTDGTYPSGISGSQGYGYLFSGTLGAMEYCIDDAEMVAGGLLPTGSFTVIAEVTPLYVSAQNHIAGVWIQTGNQRAWGLLQSSATTASAWFSQDGSTTCLVTNNANMVNGRRSFVAIAYTYVPGGSSTSSLTVDGTTTSSSASCGPPYDGATQKFQVAANGVSSTTCAGIAGSAYAGIIHNIAYYNGTVLSSAQIAGLRNQSLSTFSSLKSPLTITHANPYYAMVATPSSGTEPFMVQTPANTVLIGPYGAYFGGPYTNRIPRGGFESCAAAGGTEPDGWTVVETAGDGSAAIDCDTTTRADGYRSVKIALTGTTSVGALKSTCRTVGMGADTYAFAYAKKTAGTSVSNLYVEQFTGASNCTGAQVDLNITSPADLSTSWGFVGGKIPALSWTIGTQSFRIVWQETCDGGCTTYVDSMNAIGSAVPVDASCVCDTAFDCTCSAPIDVYEKNPLNVATWSFSVNVRRPMPWSTAGGIYIASVPGTSGNNNEQRLYMGANTLFYDCYDSSGTLRRATVSTSGGLANTTYNVIAQHTAAGNVRTCWNGTCGSWTTGCTLTAMNNNFRLGHNGTTAGEVWLRDVKISNRIVGP